MDNLGIRQGLEVRYLKNMFLWCGTCEIVSHFVEVIYICVVYLLWDQRDFAETFVICFVLFLVVSLSLRVVWILRWLEKSSKCLMVFPVPVISATFQGSFSPFLLRLPDVLFCCWVVQLQPHSLLFILGHQALFLLRADDILLYYFEERKFWGEY